MPLAPAKNNSSPSFQRNLEQLAEVFNMSRVTDTEEYHTCTGIVSSPVDRGFFRPSFNARLQSWVRGKLKCSYGRELAVLVLLLFVGVFLASRLGLELTRPTGVTSAYHTGETKAQQTTRNLWRPRKRARRAFRKQLSNDTHTHTAAASSRQTLASISALPKPAVEDNTPCQNWAILCRFVCSVVRACLLRR